MEENQISLVMEPQGLLAGHRTVIVAGAATVLAVGIGMALWQPWLDRSPFTAYRVGLQEAQYTVPGSSPGTCVRTAASEEERVIYAEDGERLAAGRDPREGEVLGPEFGEFAGDCLFISHIDNVPGGKGTYLVQWGGGTRHAISEEDLRESAERQKERFKTHRKSDVE
ncbi:hypothetical protein [Streptomyces sp. b84]|uniref:hypothetical protein n=1 Tax=Streptomyces sp. b84 TaxID=1827631 RepID=UPI000BF1C5BA|nr:hypothetical protein [Streptomyces sp. b84]